MIRRPPRSTRTDTLFPYTTLFRSPEVSDLAGVWRVNEEDMIVRTPNPNLTPAISNNFSVRAAQYFEPIGMVAINFYMNKVKGLFQSQELTAAEYGNTRSEAHTSELQSLMRHSYAVFCLQKNTTP